MEALDVPKSTVNNWAMGKNLPDAHRWGAIEEALGLEPMALAKAAEAGLGEPGVEQLDERGVVAVGDTVLRLGEQSVERVLGVALGPADGAHGLAPAPGDRVTAGVDDEPPRVAAPLQ